MAFCDDKFAEIANEADNHMHADSQADDDRDVNGVMRCGPEAFK